MKRTRLLLLALAACGGNVVVDRNDAASVTTTGSSAGGAPGAGGASGGAGGASDVGKIRCGASTCTLPEICQVSYQLAPPTCALPAPEGAYNPPCGQLCTFAACDGPEDCPEGQACAETYPDSNTGFLCSPWADGCNESNPVLCHDDADCPACAPSCAPMTIHVTGFAGFEMDVMACQ